MSGSWISTFHHSKIGAKESSSRISLPAHRVSIDVEEFRFARVEDPYFTNSGQRVYIYTGFVIPRLETVSVSVNSILSGREKFAAFSGEHSSRTSANLSRRKRLTVPSPPPRVLIVDSSFATGIVLMEIILDREVWYF